MYAVVLGPKCRYILDSFSKHVESSCASCFTELHKKVQLRTTCKFA